MRHFRGLGLMAAIAGMGMAVPGVVLTEPRAPVARKTKSIREALPATEFRRTTKLNRSRHWDHAETYKDARAISPFPHRTVR